MGKVSSEGHGRFHGKVAIITGSSTGIGAAVAARFAAEGASVVLSGRRVQLLEAKAEELKELGYQVLAVPGDVNSTSATVVQRAIEELCLHPEMGARRVLKNPALRGLRTWPVEGFPAMRIYYLCDEDVLRIMRVLHGRRDVDPMLEEDDGPF